MVNLVNEFVLFAISASAAQLRENFAIRFFPEKILDNIKDELSLQIFYLMRLLQNYPDRSKRIICLVDVIQQNYHVKGLLGNRFEPYQKITVGDFVLFKRSGPYCTVGRVDKYDGDVLRIIFREQNGIPATKSFLFDIKENVFTFPDSFLKKLEHEYILNNLLGTNFEYAKKSDLSTGDIVLLKRSDGSYTVGKVYDPTYLGDYIQIIFPDLKKKPGMLLDKNVDRDSHDSDELLKFPKSLSKMIDPDIE